MKRYMWHAHFRTKADPAMGVSSSDPIALVRDALRLNASSIGLYRGEEIKGKLPTLESMRGMMEDKISIRYKKP